jgi:hypothetical protein
MVNLLRDCRQPPLACRCGSPSVLPEAHLPPSRVRCVRSPGRYGQPVAWLSLASARVSLRLPVRAARGAPAPLPRPLCSLARPLWSTCGVVVVSLRSRVAAAPRPACPRRTHLPFRVRRVRSPGRYGQPVAWLSSASPRLSLRIPVRAARGAPTSRPASVASAHQLVVVTLRSFVVSLPSFVAAAPCPSGWRCRQPPLACRQPPLACRCGPLVVLPEARPAPPFRARGAGSRPGAGDSSLDAHTAATRVLPLPRAVPHLGR